MKRKAKEGKPTARREKRGSLLLVEGKQEKRVKPRRK